MTCANHGAIMVDIPVLAHQTWVLAVVNEDGVDLEETKKLAEIINSDYSPTHKHIYEGGTQHDD
jgi:hypothetical protein